MPNTIGEWIWFVWYWLVFTGFVVSLALHFRVDFAAFRARGQGAYDHSARLAAIARSFYWIAMAFALGVQVLEWPHLILHHLGGHL